MKARILSVGTSVPPQSYTQDEVFAMAGYTRKAIQGVFLNSGIKRRHLGVESHYRAETDPEWFTKHYESWAPRLALAAANQALERAGVSASDVDYLVATSCTGYLCPGISQRLAQLLNLGSRAKTANLVGMGCNAAVPALERATEFVERYPGRTALVVSVEVSSAAYWIDNRDLESAVGNAIFSDGASAAVVRATDGPLGSGKTPMLRAFATTTNRDLIHYMGFHNQAGRLRVLLSREVPEAVMPLADDVIAQLLDVGRLRLDGIHSWVLHPGGKRILEVASERWKLGEELRPSWDVLADYGNMSSATILFVLERHWKAMSASTADARNGLMIAMGPGLSVEGALLEWT